MVFPSFDELKNSLTGQTHLDGEKQWRRDRDPKEPLFIFEKLLVYFSLVMKRFLHLVLKKHDSYHTTKEWKIQILMDFKLIICGKKF